MNAEQLRVALAERVGWRRMISGHWLPPGKSPFSLEGAFIQSNPPDYARSLDAVHEAILHLRRHGDQFQWLEFERHLFAVVWGREPKVPEDTFYLGSSHSFEITNATALQRAVALGLTWSILTPDQAQELLREGV